MREEAKAVYINMMTLEDTEKQRAEVSREEGASGHHCGLPPPNGSLHQYYTQEMRAFLEPQSSERVC